MKNLSIIITLVALTVFCSQMVFSQTATQNVTLEVQAINKISTSGPVSLTINDATPGGEPVAVSNSATTYSITHNGSSAGKITASINTALPAGIKLELTLASSIGSSKGKKDISSATTAVDVVDNIGLGKDAAQTITYDFSATTAAGVFASTTKAVTLTVSN